MMKRRGAFKKSDYAHFFQIFCLFEIFSGFLLTFSHVSFGVFILCIFTRFFGRLDFFRLSTCFLSFYVLLSFYVFFFVFSHVLQPSVFSFVIWHFGIFQLFTFRFFGFSNFFCPDSYFLVFPIHSDRNLSTCTQKAPKKITEIAGDAIKESIFQWSNFCAFKASIKNGAVNRSTRKNKTLNAFTNEIGFFTKYRSISESKLN